MYIYDHIYLISVPWILLFNVVFEIQSSNLTLKLCLCSRKIFPFFLLFSFLIHFSTFLLLFSFLIRFSTYLLLFCFLIRFSTFLLLFCFSFLKITFVQTAVEEWKERIQEFKFLHWNCLKFNQKKVRNFHRVSYQLFRRKLGKRLYKNTFRKDWNILTFS